MFSEGHLSHNGRKSRFRPLWLQPVSELSGQLPCLLSHLSRITLSTCSQGAAQTACQPLIGHPFSWLITGPGQQRPSQNRNHLNQLSGLPGYSQGPADPRLMLTSQKQLARVIQPHKFTHPYSQTHLRQCRSTFIEIKRCLFWSAKLQKGT